MSIEQPIAKCAEVDPIVDIKFIEPEVTHSERGIIIDPHTAEQKSKNCPGVTPQDLPQGRRSLGALSAGAPKFQSLNFSVMKTTSL